MSRRLPLALIATAALAAPALAQQPSDDLGGFDPIRSVSVQPEQRGFTVRGTVDVAVEGSDVVARVLRKGRLLGRLAYEDVPAGPLDSAVRMFRSGRELLVRKQRMRVRLEFAVDPPADPPQRARRAVRLRR